MLGLQGSASSSKVYRCVACSATFNGLASLLVHQATHASVLPKVSRPQAPPQGNTRTDDKLFTITDLPSEQQSSSSEGPSLSFFICDCGEEFHDFNLMLEHKLSHVPEAPLLPSLDDGSAQSVLFTPVGQPSLVPSCTSTPAAELPIMPTHKAEIDQEGDVAIVTTPEGQCSPLQHEDELENMSTTEEQKPETVEEMSFEDETNSVHSTATGEDLPRNNAIMKMLASAYKNRYPPPQSPDRDITVPDQEIVPVDKLPKAKTLVSTINDLSIVQLRRLLTKPGIKTKAPSISRILESSKKKVVSLTKTLSPVVLLETRQKLRDPGSNGKCGTYQCGRCRRVFQDLDKLAEHHFLHKKERIKCCRRCKQLIIGRLPFPDNHVCPQMGNKNARSSSSFKSRPSFVPKLVPFHSLSNARKVFFCPLCKHSYARRWNLKTHKCQGPGSAAFRHGSPSNQSHGKMSHSKMDGYTPASHVVKNVSVGTDKINSIKVEVTSPDCEDSPGPQLGWAHPANHFSPFSPKSSIMDHEEENSWNSAELNDEDSGDGQWTMPLDDDMEIFSSTVKSDEDSELKASVKVEHTGIISPNLRYFVKDGVRRYPCNKCQKTYSRASTLRRHLRLCGLRPRGFGTVAQSSSQSATAQNSTRIKPMFPCFVCGKTFNRKDNMMVHRKKCELQRTMSGGKMGAFQQSLPANTTTDSQNQGMDQSNWGIMSLPSVLPRRVTCECGVGFTSPRLLLDHLQKHAQESYTCPTCGETVNSWADYEIHLQIHMHSSHQLLKGMQPQRSQPLLLRFQQDKAQHLSQSAHRPPQNQPRPESSFPNPTKKTQRIVCTRCGNTFATRCSLRRHLSWNRCKGGRVTNLLANPPKTHHCSHCNSDFPNAISLIFHQRSGACKPAIKPVRCSVCLRWFGTVDSLQKHLLTHKQSYSYSCDVCQGTYPNLKSLKNHRRRIHRIMAGDTKPNPQEQLTA